MSLIIELEPSLEAELRQQAAKAGMDASLYAVRALEEQLRDRTAAMPPRLGDVESRLLKRISRGWPEKKWNRYGDLVGKRRQEVLTEPEHEELIALGDDLERWNARRLQNLIQLARIRQTSVDSLMQQLGIKPRNV
jgi:hypothetical protein